MPRIFSVLIVLSLITGALPAQEPAAPGAAADADTLRAHCAATLPEAKIPKRIVFIGALPRNPRGKIDRGVLMEMWWEDKN